MTTMMTKEVAGSHQDMVPKRAQREQQSREMDHSFSYLLVNLVLFVCVSKTWWTRALL